MEKKTSPKAVKKIPAAKDSKNKNGKKDFLVVGVGASAGGVKALQEFFASMPPNSGMSFVVILHLSPQHESSLPQILQAQTTMPVVQVTETHKVEPNRVYVIPPNSQLEMFDGSIRCEPPEKKAGTRVAIDVFFRTLAEAYGKNAVCVVLSGTGSDGTLGLKRVKESNGFAIVQSPEDAEYDQMPRNAIATGLADWILPVRQMPEKLLYFRESSERLHLTNGADAGLVAEEINAEDSLREIITILRVRTGHDFANYKTPTLIRRIARHLQIHELEDLPTYVKYLRDNQEEIQSLQRNLLINVTNFFRDKDAFGALETEVVPRLFTGKTARDTVRVWTAGCASGEEAYSMAMLLTEYTEKQSDPPKFMVFATDIDDEAIAQAREHSYPETIETDVSPERLKRFFVKEGSRYRVKKELRETVLFVPHNVLRDPPFSRLDLVTCRNLLIYLNREAQKQVMEIFHFALKSEGFLFLGTSETAENAPDLFEAIEKKQRLYRRRPASHGYHAPPRMPVAGNWQTSPPISADFAERAKISSLGEVHYKLLENLAPPSVLVNEDFEIVYMSQSVGRYLRFTGGEPTNNLLKLVNPELLPDLRAALFTAQRERLSSEFTDIDAVIEGTERRINLNVRVVDTDDGNGNFLLVIFDEADENNPSYSAKVKQSDKKSVRSADRDEAVATIIKRLEEELRRSKASLRATLEQHEISTEELKASNEELQAINEELRSATEELETSKEELQSVNEEMNTVNSELKDRIEESGRANSDLQNLISSTDIATIFLDRKLHIKRFSPLIERLFNITRTDIGRPLEHFTHRLEYRNLTADAKEALKTLKTVEREISDKDSRYFLTRFSPYRTTDDRIEGVVLNFLEITKYKRTEEALRSVEEEYRAALEREVEARTGELKESRDELASRSHVFEATLSTITDFIYQFDREGRFIYVNQPLLDLWGIKEEEAVGKNFYELDYPEELAERLHRQIERVFKTGEKLRDETAYTSPTGAGGFYEYIFTPLKDANGAVRSVVGSTQDITARKNSEETTSRAEQSLHESEERLRIAVEAAEMATWDWNLTNDLVKWNEQHFLLFGMKPTKNPVRPEDFFRHVHPDDQGWLGERLKQAAATNQTFQAEFRIIRVDDGALRWMEGYGRVVEEANGKPTRMSGVMSDITARKYDAEALSESEIRFRAVVNQAAAGVAELDLRGNHKLVNETFCKLLGYTESELLQLNLRDIVYPEDLPHCLKLFEKTIKTGESQVAEKRLIRRDGEIVWISDSVALVTDIYNNARGVASVAVNITELKQAESAVREKQTLARLIAGQEEERRRIARDIHDHFGQQLTALRMKLDAARQTCGEQKICDEIEEAQQIAGRLDADVDFIAWELRPVALEDLGLMVALNNFVREWSHHTGIAIEFHSTGLNKINLAFETETNLYRIAQEALNNIYKHAAAKRVSVLLERRKNKINLIIEDDGAGFDVEDKLNRGKGIGLNGMNERAVILGGAFEVESQKDRGTTVYARVPLAKNEEKE